MTEPSESWTPQRPHSTRRLALKGLARALRADQPSRLVIAGGPRAGKTTLAESLERPLLPVHGSDELMAREWSESSLIASTWFDALGPWICEGLVLPRALRKWLARTGGDQKPADLIVYLDEPV